MTTDGLLNAQDSYALALTGEQVEVVRRHLVSGRTMIAVHISEAHPKWASGMAHEMALIEAILDALPVGEVPDFPVGAS